MQGRAIVTGVAGFIGSHLAERLLADGHEVLGIDCLTDHYDPRLKRRNLSGLLDHSSFEFAEEDLVTADLRVLLRGAGVVFHQAAQPGVRASWGREFERYTRDNVMATQRLLEAAKDLGEVRVVFASSSSIYGDVERVPMREDDLPAPHSPYGVTKLACEHLCRLYTRNHGLPTVSLRYFTVFGPRQRPDMAMHRLIQACLSGGQFELYGDGSQRRDFTHVSDIVEANLRAVERGAVGGVYNVGGGNQITLGDLVERIADLTGARAEIVRRGPQRGDVHQTLADISEARRDLGFEPRVGLDDGLRSEIAWLEELMRSPLGDAV